MALLKKEQAALKKFRKRTKDIIAKLDHYDAHDVNLVRWLRACNLEVDKAEEMFRKSMKWRKVNKIRALAKTPELDEHLLQKMPARPGGRDKEGTLVVIVPFGIWDVKTLLQEGYRDKMFVYIIKLLELCVQHLKDMSSGKNMQTQFVIIFDLSQFCMKQVLSQQVLSWTREIFRLFDTNYPERLKAAYVINVPKIFGIFWPLVNPLLSQHTLSKVNVLKGKSDHWRAKLRESIGSHELPSDLGGCNTTQHFFSNLFGPSVLTMPRAPLYHPADFTTVVLPAGRRLLVRLQLFDGNRVTWNFRTELHDIGFELFQDDLSLFPYAKADAHICVQDGLVDVIQDGIYTLVFDNSYCQDRSKVLHYAICVDEVFRS